MALTLGIYSWRETNIAPTKYWAFVVHFHYHYVIDSTDKEAPSSANQNNQAASMTCKLDARNNAVCLGIRNKITWYSRSFCHNFATNGCELLCVSGCRGLGMRNMEQTSSVLDFIPDYIMAIWRKTAIQLFCAPILGRYNYDAIGFQGDVLWVYEDAATVH